MAISNILKTTEFRIKLQLVKYGVLKEEMVHIMYVKHCLKIPRRGQ